jgi:hypothetical protein
VGGTAAWPLINTGLERMAQSVVGADNRIRTVLTSLEGFMLRQVMMPSKENSTISIPAEFYGMEVEVLVYPFCNTKANQNSDRMNDIFDNHMYSFGKFKFNRDEANNYD